MGCAQHIMSTGISFFDEAVTMHINALVNASKGILQLKKELKQAQKDKEHLNNIIFDLKEENRKLKDLVKDRHKDQKPSIVMHDCVVMAEDLAHKIAMAMKAQGMVAERAGSQTINKTSLGNDGIDCRTSLKDRNITEIEEDNTLDCGEITIKIDDDISEVMPCTVPQDPTDRDGLDNCPAVDTEQDCTVHLVDASLQTGDKLTQLPSENVPCVSSKNRGTGFGGADKMPKNTRGVLSHQHLIRSVGRFIQSTVLPSKCGSEPITVDCDKDLNNMTESKDDKPLIILSTGHEERMNQGFANSSKEVPYGHRQENSKEPVLRQDDVPHFPLDDIGIAVENNLEKVSVPPSFPTSSGFHEHDGGPCNVSLAVQEKELMPHGSCFVEPRSPHFDGRISHVDSSTSHFDANDEHCLPSMTYNPSHHSLYFTGREQATSNLINDGGHGWSDSSPSLPIRSGRVRSQSEKLSSIKLYRCETCSKTFTLKSSLKIHLRTHTGEKPYRCDTCGKGFSVKTNLIRHIRIHSGERPYTCTICRKAFTQVGHLKKHVTLHSEKSLHGSNVNRKIYSTPHSMNET